MPRSKNHTRRVARSRPRGIMQLNPEGYGFVRTSEGEFFVPHAKLGGAFDGDLVEVAPLPANASKGRSHEGFGGGRYAHKPAARVVSVVERAHEVVVGRFEAAEPFGVVVPLDPHIPYDIFTQLSEAPDVEDGAIVRVRIAQFPSRNSAATGHIEEVLEHVDGLDEGVDAVVARHKFETVFSDAALAEARGASIDEVGTLASGYRDLRERFVFTIDPDDARDFDDALSIEQVKDQGRLLWRIGVHIADVSHYVEWGSALDLTARRRATSVYLVDRVIPMIPEDLSCGLCSLAPGEVRRSMTVELYADERAQLARYEIYPALICSNVRLTYGEVLEMLGGEGEPAASEGGKHAPCSDSPALENSPLGCSRRAELRAAHAHQAQEPHASWTNAPSIKNLYSKLAGISSEVHAGGICVGIGVNVEPPEGAMEVGGKNAPAYLADLGFGFTCEREAAINAVGDAVLHEFEPLYRRWCDGGFAALSGEFAEHSMLEGRFVRMANQLGEVVCEGTVRGVDASGRLLLRLEDGETKAVASGEVHLL